MHGVLQATFANTQPRSDVSYRLTIAHYLRDDGREHAGRIDRVPRLAGVIRKGTVEKGVEVGGQERRRHNRLPVVPAPA